MNGILSTIGNTPLAKLERFLDTTRIELFAKLECFNPGGSIKDRPALQMISQAMADGHINKNTVVIESSSGNLGIGLAQICAYFGLQLICVIDCKTSVVNRKILEAYGATIDLIEQPDPETNEFLTARIKRVQNLLETTPNSFNCNQYVNLNNPKAHHRTMAEILLALDNKVDYLFCATSTCGTLRGCAEYTAQRKLDVNIIAVDAQGSVIFGDTPRPRLIPGHGAGQMPQLYYPGLETTHILASDLDCVVGCRRLLRREAIFAGGSSGAVLSSIDKMQTEIPDGARCVAIICDRGERYMDTIYSDSWVSAHFGDVSHLWQQERFYE
jgi:cysteine synthase A